MFAASELPASALAAGRWVLGGDQVLLEGHAPERWFDGLIARGHRVLRREPFREEFGQAQLIVVRAEHLAGASDPRSATWAAAPL